MHWVLSGTSDHMMGNAPEVLGNYFPLHPLVRIGSLVDTRIYWTYTTPVVFLEDTPDTLGSQMEADSSVGTDS